MNGIITHEESQAVTLAMVERGNNFFSCDLQECSGGRPDIHIVSDCFQAVKLLDLPKPIGLDFVGMHPVCKYLANSGVSSLARKQPTIGFEWSEKYQKYINWSRYELMKQAAEHFLKCYETVRRIGKGYIENPIMHGYAMELIGIPPTQVIQPWMFGSMEQKATCLWLIGLPKLKETNNVYAEMMKLPNKERQRIHWLGSGKEKERSKTDSNIAKAMADQWG